MEEIVTGNHKDPYRFLAVAGKCNEDSSELSAFSFQAHMPFSDNIFTTLWQQLSPLFA